MLLLASPPTALPKLIPVTSFIQNYSFNLPAAMIKSYYAEFFTATILNWQKLLHNDLFKQIIVDSLQWLVKEKRYAVYAFVIMPNHMHLLWCIAPGLEREMVQGS